jgi:hypothetical protein
MNASPEIDAAKGNRDQNGKDERKLRRGDAAPVACGRKRV